ncbi:MAG TPA: TIM barrel protein [Bryobacteraceae bacterium]|nr:TIM barrel protein [Bryobacteraceae bacterium]
MTRRALLQAAGAAAACLSNTPAPADVMGQFHNLGGAPAGFPMASRAAREANQPFDFVEYCHNLGFGVVETRLDLTNAEAVRQFRQRIEAFHMRAILDVPLPRDEAGVATFDAAIRNAKEAGVRSLHTAMTQRRYEQFDTLDAFKRDFERCQKTIALAEPVLRKYKLPLGIENHKGWRAGEQAAWLKRVGSEWVGVHLDFGNNVALCEDPSETLRILEPYTVSCHIKDMAVDLYEDGFLLAEVPLGEGFLDIKGMVASLKKKDPNMPFDLEMITRDPLKIPVFTDKYWATFDDAFSPLPGRDLARVLEIVHKNKPKSPLPRTTGMSMQAQLQLENQNVSRSIAYARQYLDL